MRTKEGLFITLDEPETYAIVDDVPPYSYNAAVDKLGRNFPLRVTSAGRKWLLRADLKGALYPVTLEIRTVPAFCLSTCVL